MNRQPHGANGFGLSRRDLLTGLAGLPAVWVTGGCGQRTRHQIEGEIVGASDRAGHRLRAEFRPQPPNSDAREVAVVIVGAGVAGLSAAWRLRRAGFNDFILLELEPHAGGTSRGGELNGIPCPWGAHYIPAPFDSNRGLIALLKEMDLFEDADADGLPNVREECLCRDPEERLFINGAWREGLSPLDINDLNDQQQWRMFQSEVNRWAGWKDGKGRRAFTIPIAECSDDSEVTQLDRETMSDWLAQHGLTSPRLRWLVDYACRDDYGMTVEQTSAWAGLFYFASRVRRPGDQAQPLITWPRGNGQVVEHLQQPIRDRIRTGMTVTEIVPRDTEAGTAIEVIAAGPDPASAERFRAQRVVFAVPQFLAPWLIAGYRAARGTASAEFEYGSWMVANLFLKDRPAERHFELAWDNVIYDSASLGYVVATHQLGRNHGPTVFTYYYPLCDADPRQAREKLLSRGWAEWAEIALSDLETAHPEIRTLVERLDVMRFGHAMIRPRPGFVWGSARRAMSQPFGGIHFAHSDLSGIALFEEAFYHGNRAAEEILAALNVPSASVL